MASFVRRRRPHNNTIAAQVLESRALLSASAALKNNVLTITGTPGGDNILVQNYGAYTRVVANGQTINTTPTSAVKQIVVNTGSGSDALTIAHGWAQFDRITINMGTGNNERLYLSTNLVKNLVVDGSQTQINATLSNTTITRMDATFGNYNDKLILQNNSVVDTMSTNMGGGNDSVTLSSGAAVNSGTLDMNSGDDYFARLRTTKITATIQGGSGGDWFQGFDSDGRRVTLRSFERIEWL